MNFKYLLKKIDKKKIEQIITPAPDPAVIIILEPSDLKILKKCFNNAIVIANYIDDEESRFSYMALKTKITTQLFAQNQKL